MHSPALNIANRPTISHYIGKIYPAVLFLFLITFSEAQVQTPARIENTENPNARRLSWNSSISRSYFLQQSPNLATWSYLPKVLKGRGGQDTLTIASSAPKEFYRLIWSDYVVNDPLTADHDGDGVPSYAELTVTKTDPLKASTDGKSDRGKFPNPSNGVYIDSATGVQYVIVPNSPGTTGSPKIVASRYFETPDYGIEIKNGELSLPKRGYPEFTSPTTPANSKVRYLKRLRQVSLVGYSTGSTIPRPWDFGYTWTQTLPIHKVVLYNSNDWDISDIHPVTGTETITGGTGSTGKLNNLINKPDNYVWQEKRPYWRWYWVAATINNDYYDVPPFGNWEGIARPYYEEQLYEENTPAKMVATAQANRPAYAKNWSEGNPWAQWDHWTNELGLTYTRTKFRIENKNGVTNGEPARIFVYFTPESGGAKEQVMSVQWDGNGTYSPEYEIDPATLKPGVEGTYSINGGSILFELDLAQETDRRAGDTVFIPVEDSESESLSSIKNASRQLLKTAANAPTTTPEIKFPGMDDSWYEDATITVTKIDGTGSISLRAINQSTGHEIPVPLGQNLAPDFFHSRGIYSNYAWEIRGIDAGTISLRLAYIKGETNLILDRSGYVTPKVNLHPETVPVDGLTRAKIRISNLGSTKVPVLSTIQMPVITIGTVQATEVRQDEFDPNTFYFTPPAATSQGSVPVKISNITIGGLAFSNTGHTLDPYEDWPYVDSLNPGIASFSDSISICIDEALSSSLKKKSSGSSPDDAAEEFMNRMSSRANEGMGLIKNFASGKSFLPEDEESFNRLANDNSRRIENALISIFNGAIPASIPESIPVSTGGPNFSKGTFFPEVRAWMESTGERIYKGSAEGGSVQFAVIEANEFDLKPWTTATTNHNIYNAISANPKASIIINGALFNYKSEVFTTTGVAYSNGVKLPTSTAPSKKSFVVAGLRYWFGQKTDNSMAANGSSGDSFQFGGKGHAPAPSTPPAPNDFHSSIGGMISCIWPDGAGNGQKVTAAMDTDLKTYTGFQGGRTGWGIIGIDLQKALGWSEHV